MLNTVQGLLLGHPKVNDVAVIGIQIPALATELPRAYIVLQQNEVRDKRTSDEISKWVESRVANHKRLRGGIKFVDVIPKSPTGKILRRVLKEQAAKEEQRMAKL